MATRYLAFIQLQQTVKSLLGEQTLDSSGITVNVESEYWSDAELGRYINDAYTEAARLTKGLELIEAVSTTADQATYTLSSSVGQIFRVSYDDRKLYNVTKWELDRSEPDWENESGYVSHYVTGLMANRQIRLYKAPTISGGLSVSGEGEYGIIIDIAIGDGSDTYTFSSEYGPVVETSGTGWTADFTGEYGVATLTGGAENAFEVWATKNPSSLSGNARPEFPNWSHMGIAFRAAAKALRKYGEHKQMNLADSYDLIAQDYMALLKGFVSQRSSDKLTTQGWRTSNQRKPMPWDQTIEEV